MSKLTLFRIRFKAKVQQGTWHSHDDLEITGYGPHKEQFFHVAAPNEHYARTWWEDNIRYWSKEHETELLKIEDLGSLSIVRLD